MKRGHIYLLWFIVIVCSTVIPITRVMGADLSRSPTAPAPAPAATPTPDERAAAATRNLGLVGELGTHFNEGIAAIIANPGGPSADPSRPSAQDGLRQGFSQLSAGQFADLQQQVLDQGGPEALRRLNLERQLASPTAAVTPTAATPATPAPSGVTININNNPSPQQQPQQQAKQEEKKAEKKEEKKEEKAAEAPTGQGAMAAEAKKSDDKGGEGPKAPTIASPGTQVPMNLLTGSKADAKAEATNITTIMPTATASAALDLAFVKNSAQATAVAILSINRPGGSGPALGPQFNSAVGVGSAGGNAGKTYGVASTDRLLGSVGNAGPSALPSGYRTGTASGSTSGNRFIVDQTVDGVMAVGAASAGARPRAFSEIYGPSVRAEAIGESSVNSGGSAVLEMPVSAAGGHKTGSK